MVRSVVEETAPTSASVNVGRVRWVIVALLFAATAINYVDRQMIGLLKPTLQKEFSWHETTYADIVFYSRLPMRSVTSSFATSPTASVAALGMPGPSLS